MKPVLCFLALFMATTAAYSQKSARPNIIFIFADDLGYGDLGCYGQKKIETPNIDKLAKDGVRFTQFYSGSTVCAPSRASLMTGLHTGHTAVRGNKGTKPEGQTPLPDSVVTIANLLQQHGYATAAFGKWGLGYITTSGAPDKKGFQKFFGYNCQSLAHDYYPDHLWDNDKRIDLAENLAADSVYSSDLIHQQAINFIREKRSQPYFAFLPYTIPHGDVILPHDSVYHYYIKKFNEQPLTERPAFYSNKTRTLEPYPHAAFAAMVSRLDKYVGEIITTLKATGQLENTVIIFSSDNGPHRENGGDPDFFDGNSIYRGIKRDLYDGGIRVPLIISWKGRFKPNTPSHIVAGWDIYPTLQSVAGMTPSKNIDGISLLPILLGHTKVDKEHEYLYWEFHEQNGKQAVRWRQWKGIRLQVNKNADGPVELYDISADPGEQNNVAAKHPDVVKQIEKFMKEAHVPNMDWPLLPNEMKDAKTAETSTQ